MAVVNKSQVKEMAGDFRVSSQFYDELDEVVRKAIRAAQQRAKNNGRSTLMPYDL